MLTRDLLANSVLLILLPTHSLFTYKRNYTDLHAKGGLQMCVFLVSAGPAGRTP